MPTYFFQLGNTPQLSLRELEVLIGEKPELVSAEIARLESNTELDLSEIQFRSGGLVKTYEQVAEFSTTSIDEIESQIVENLLESEGRIDFSISKIGTDAPNIDPRDIKKLLKGEGRSVRYLETDKDGLSAAVLQHQDVTELTLINLENHLVLAKTMTVQDIDDWTKRDRSKPYFDQKKGMLPPKVARILVNLGLNLVNTDQPTIFDPFCGSGTILMEGLMLGVNVLGSDLDQDAVTGSNQNLSWLKEVYQLEGKTEVFRHDATQAFDKNLAEKIDLIVTEPFLGQPTPQEKKLPNIFTGLYKLYLGAFKQWAKILKPGTPIVIIFPLVETKNKTFNLNNLIDKLEELGYTTVSEPLIYSRPQAIVKRQINFLRYKG